MRHSHDPGHAFDGGGLSSIGCYIDYTCRDNMVRFPAGSPWFNPDWKNRDPVCEFPPKVQPGLSLEVLIFYLRVCPGIRNCTNRTLLVNICSKLEFSTFTLQVIENLQNGIVEVWVTEGHWMVSSTDHTLWLSTATIIHRILVIKPQFYLPYPYLAPPSRVTLSLYIKRGKNVSVRP